MMIYLVNQGKTWEQERSGGFLWSPKFNREGHRNAGYELMKKVKKDDYILHNKGGMIAAISIAKVNCYDALQPDEIQENSGTYVWNMDGYRVDTVYFDFSEPLLTAHLAEWAKLHPRAGSCFGSSGKLKQQYLCHVAEEDARYVIDEVLKREKDPRVKTVLYDALSSLGLGEDEYDDEDSEAIENLIALPDNGEKIYSGWLKRPQEMTTTGGSSKEKPKREPKKAANALRNANYKCEYDSSDRTFLRKKSGKPYTEPHHLIPISRYKAFSTSVDVEENIVSLCSHCHNLLHYGCMKEKEEVLYKLYKDRISKLEASGLELSFDELKSYYK